MNQKARMGISVGLLAAAVYFMGIINIVPMVILAGYVLLFESDVWLRKSAVKAVVIYVAFAMLNVLLQSADSVFNIVDVVSSTASVTAPLNISYVLRTALWIVETILFIILGVKALAQGTVKIKPTDELVDRHM